jgi:hypothetical protein
MCGGLLAAMILSLAFALAVIETGSIMAGDQTVSFILNAVAGGVLLVLLAGAIYFGTEIADLKSNKPKSKGPVQFPYA